MGHNQEAEPLELHSQAPAWERVEGARVERAGVEGVRAEEHSSNQKKFMSKIVIGNLI